MIEFHVMTSNDNVTMSKINFNTFFFKLYCYSVMVSPVFFGLLSVEVMP